MEHKKHIRDNEYNAEEKGPSATSLKRRIRRMPTMFAAALGLVTIAAVAQSEDGSEPGVAKPARPQVDTVETVTIEGAGYDLLVYLQEDKNLRDKDAHLYYTPLFYVVTESEKVLKHRIDDNNVLTLKIRRDPDTEGIEAAVREELIVLAKKRNPAFTLEAGTVPYRLDPLKMSKVMFTSSKRRPLGANGEMKVLTSEPVEMSAVEVGEITVDFYLESREEAEDFIRDLQADYNQLVMKYRFAGVSDEECRAKFEGSGTRSIELFKKVTGEGGVGKVSRRQAARIADVMVRSGSVVARCAEFDTAENLMDRLMEKLGDYDTVDVANWEQLDRLIAFDADSFKADVETSVKTLKKEVTRKQILAALANAQSEARSGASGLGVSAGYGPFHASISRSLADTQSQDKSEARKDYEDMLAKKGLSVEWSGKRFIPKSVDVHSTAELENAWGRTFEIAYLLTAGEVGKGTIRLTQESWENAISSERERRIEQRLAKMEEIVAKSETTSEHALKISTAAQSQSNEARRNAGVAHSVASAAKGASTSARTAALQARKIASQARVRANQAHGRENEAINVEYCRYHLKNPHKNPPYYFYDFLRSDKVAILSGVDVNCGDDEFDVILARRSRNDNDWIVKIDHLACEWIRLDVVFFNGSAVGNNKFYNTTMGSYPYSPMKKLGKWCYAP